MSQIPGLEGGLIVNQRDRTRAATDGIPSPWQTTQRKAASAHSKGRVGLAFWRAKFFSFSLGKKH